MASQYIEMSERIREDIVRGSFASGERLKLADLAKRYSTSHMPIREALRILNGQGLVEFMPNSGMRVRKIDYKFMSDLFDIRLALEAVQSRRAAQRLTPKASNLIFAARENYEQEVQRGDQDSMLRANHRFHQSISDASGNKEAREIEERHYQILRIVWYQFGGSLQRIDQIIDDHRMITTAILDRDSEAASILSEAHVMRARINLLARIKEMEAAAAD